MFDEIRVAAWDMQTHLDSFDRQITKKIDGVKDLDMSTLTTNLDKLKML